MNKQDNIIKYFEYCRKSSEDNKERQMQSIESQEKELELIIKEQNLYVERIFKEEKSAHTRGRPEFGKMMNALERGEANAILVWHGNRLARNAFDGGWIITAMDEGVIKEIKTQHRTYYNTPDDKFFLQLEFGISKKDSDDKSIVVKRGLKNKCEKGWMPGVAPLGYLNTPNLVGGSRYIIKDTERFELIKKAWAMMASGKHSVIEIQRTMNEEWGFKTRQFKRQGGKFITLSLLYKIFNDSFYYGKFEFPRNSGEFYQGQHEPVINKETFDEVQRLLNRKVKSKPHTKNFAYTGTIMCGECGGQITASEKWKHQKNGNSHHYIFYHCTKRKSVKCSQPYLQEHLLEEQINNLLNEISITPEFFETAMQWLKEQNTKESQGRNIVLESQQRAYTICLKKIDGLIDMRAGGEVTEEEFKAKKAELLKERERLENLLNGTGKKAEHWLKLAEDVFTFARDVKLRFEIGDWQTKKQILQMLGSKFILKDNKLYITLDELLFPVQTIAKEVKSNSDWLEPPKNVDNKRKTSILSLASPTLLRGLDLNQRPQGYEPCELPDCSTPR